MCVNIIKKLHSVRDSIKCVRKLEGYDETKINVLINMCSAIILDVYTSHLLEDCQADTLVTITVISFILPLC